MADEAAPTIVPPPAEPVAETAAAPVATEPAKTEPAPEPVIPAENALEETTAANTAATEAPAQADDSIMDTSVVENSEVNGGSTSTPSKSKPKRKSTSTPSSGKKLQRKKSMPDLHVNVQPGEHWYVRMKGYAAWPAIICDEEMLPVSLLERRPVSAQRPDGTWREDFDEGGKNLRDRRYPVMFLGTNEFAWQVNTELAPLDIEEIKEIVEKGEQGKKTKALWHAYQIAAEEHDIDYYKNMLKEHEQRIREEEIRLAEEEAKRLQKKEEKKEKKKAVKTDADGDVVMADGAEEPAEKKKPSKKRKKEEDEDGPKKTKIVLKGLKTADEETEAKTAKKPKKAPAAPAETTPEESAVDEEELKRRKEKTILYMRHKLQKGLVTHGTPAKPEDMGVMAEHLSALENHQDLEADIIQRTKVNKLLKVILKLTTIPRDEEFNFKERCEKLLKAWNVTLQKAEEAVANAVSSAAPETNGNGTTKAQSNEPVAAPVPSIEGKVEEKKEEPVKEEPKTTNGSADVVPDIEKEKPVAATEPEKMVVDPVQ